jgi:hypothetical protein
MRDLCEVYTKIESQTTYFQANKQICLREIYVRLMRTLAISAEKVIAESAECA